MLSENATKLLGTLDLIHSNRENGIPIGERIPTYLQAANELLRIPGKRQYALNFVALAFKGSITDVFQRTVKQLESREPQINNLIDRTANSLVRGINYIASLKH